jgi:hypothetical protein
MLRELGSNGSGLKETMQEILDIKNEGTSIIEGLTNMIAKFVDNKFIEPLKCELEEIRKENA